MIDPTGMVRNIASVADHRGSRQSDLPPRPGRCATNPGQQGQSDHPEGDRSEDVPGVGRLPLLHELRGVGGHLERSQQ